MPDSPIHSAPFDDHRSFSSNEFPFFGRPSMDDIPSFDSFFGFPSRHFPALKRPIPPPTAFTRPRSSLATKQCDVCPTCRNIVYPTPRKFCRSPFGAKRMRTSMMFASPTNFDPFTPNSRQEDQISTGHFNPTYTSGHSGDSDSIYSDIAESDNTEEQRQVYRPRLIGARRLDTFRGVDMTLDNWLMKDSAETHIPVDPTYSTVLPSEYEVPISTSESEDAPGNPCLSSTLKRGVRSTDDGTIYDDVASDLEDGITLFKPVKTKRGTYLHCADLASYFNDQVKRARREYFVCEE
ncbi:unnamed protein product [Dicrocoelium dendriticum]|nr:unnamed protein product [Dicrocoelium dendriticum]